MIKIIIKTSYNKHIDIKLWGYMKETVIAVGMKIINVITKEEYRILYVG